MASVVLALLLKALVLASSVALVTCRNLQPKPCEVPLTAYYTERTETKDVRKTKFVKAGHANLSREFQGGDLMSTETDKEGNKTIKFRGHPKWHFDRRESDQHQPTAPSSLSACSLIYDEIQQADRALDEVREPGLCRYWYGLPFIDRWRGFRVQICQSRRDNDAPVSSVNCYLRKGDFKFPRVMCDFVAIRAAVWQYATGGKGWGQPGKDQWEGVQTGCTPDLQLEKEADISDSPPARFLEKLHYYGESNASGHVVCDERHWVRHPVLVLERWDPTNINQMHLDAVGAFIALAVAGLSPFETQFLAIDKQPPGPFIDFWQGMLPSHPPVFIGTRPSPATQRFYQGKLCFSRLVHGAHGGVGLMNLDWQTHLADRVLLRGNSRSEFHPAGDGHSNLCESAIMHAFRTHVLTALNVSTSQRDTNSSSTVEALDKRRPGQLSNTTTMADEFLRQQWQWPPRRERRILWLSRRPYSQVVDKARGRIHTYTPDRHVGNEAELLASLRQSLDKAAATDSRLSGWQIKDYNPGEAHTFTEQVLTATSADILMGVHGAGLTHCLYMRTGSALIELFGGNRGRENRHFDTLCSMVGQRRWEMDVGSLERVAPEGVWEKVRQAIEQLDALE